MNIRTAFLLYMMANIGIVSVQTNAMETQPQTWTSQAWNKFKSYLPSRPSWFRLPTREDLSSWANSFVATLSTPQKKALFAALVGVGVGTGMYLVDKYGTPIDTSVIAGTSLTAGAVASGLAAYATIPKKQVERQNLKEQYASIIQQQKEKEKEEDKQLLKHEWKQNKEVVSMEEVAQIFFDRTRQESEIINSDRSVDKKVSQIIDLYNTEKPAFLINNYAHPLSKAFDDLKEVAKLLKPYFDNIEKHKELQPKESYKDIIAKLKRKSGVNVFVYIMLDKMYKNQPGYE